MTGIEPGLAALIRGVRREGPRRTARSRHRSSPAARCSAALADDPLYASAGGAGTGEREPVPVEGRIRCPRRGGTWSSAEDPVSAELREPVPAELRDQVPSAWEPVPREPDAATREYGADGDGHDRPTSRGPCPGALRRPARPRPGAAPGEARGVGRRGRGRGPRPGPRGLADASAGEGGRRGRWRCGQCRGRCGRQCGNGRAAVRPVARAAVGRWLGRPRGQWLGRRRGQRGEVAGRVPRRTTWPPATVWKLVRRTPGEAAQGIGECAQDPDA